MLPAELQATSHTGEETLAGREEDQLPVGKSPGRRPGLLGG